MEIRFTPTEKHNPATQYPYPTITITVPTDDLDMDQMLEVLVKPALIGLGYAPKLVDEYFLDDNDA